MCLASCPCGLFNCSFEACSLCGDDWEDTVFIPKEEAICHELDSKKFVEEGVASDSERCKTSQSFYSETCCTQTPDEPCDLCTLNGVNFYMKSNVAVSYKGEVQTWVKMYIWLVADCNSFRRLANFWSFPFSFQLSTSLSLSLFKDRGIQRTLHQRSRRFVHAMLWGKQHSHSCSIPDWGVDNVTCLSDTRLARYRSWQLVCWLVNDFCFIKYSFHLLLFVADNSFALCTNVLSLALCTIVLDLY
jgi:hypothetical protein